MDNHEFSDHPQRYFPTIDSVGDLHIQQLYDRYAALRMLKNMFIFLLAYDVLSKRKNFSRKNAFGEMHGDGYLWIEKHPTVKVIVEERQSYRFMFIHTNYTFHIRELAYEFNFPSARKYALKGITIAKFRKQGFVPYCPQDIDKRFDGFTYGDARDDGYILSMYLFPEGRERVDHANSSTLSAIKAMEYWKEYLEDPSQLE